MNKHMVFVFGSNEAGVHGAGAARIAVVEHGAVFGQGVGHFGNSYAIPTKDRDIRTLPLSKIEEYVKEFLDYAMMNAEYLFQVTQIGCGLAGFTAAQIAPMFCDAPPNCYFDEKWKGVLELSSKDIKEFSYWGTV